VTRLLSWVLVGCLFLLGAITISQQWRLDRALRRIGQVEQDMKGLPKMTQAQKTINGVTWTWSKGAGDWPNGQLADPDESGDTFRRRVEAWCAALEGG